MLATQYCAALCRRKAPVCKRKVNVLCLIFFNLNKKMPLDQYLCAFFPHSAPEEVQTDEFPIDPEVSKLHLIFI